MNMRAITRSEAVELCKAWCKSCSTNNPESALAKFSENVQFSSPRLIQAWEKSGGQIGMFVARGQENKPQKKDKI